MQNLLRHIFLRLTVLCLITVVFVSLEMLTNYAISDFVFAEKSSFIDSEQMEKEVETETESHSKKDSVEFDLNIEFSIVRPCYHSRYLIIKSLFIPEEVSPPPEMLFIS